MSPGPVALSTACKLISPGAVVSGTLSITKTELYFEVDEEENKDLGLDSKVRDACCLFSINLFGWIHGCSSFFILQLS